MEIKESNSFNEPSNYSRALDEMGNVVYIIPGVVKRECISLDLLSRVDDVKYEYSNSGFNTLISLGRYCKEENVTELIEELSTKLDDVCYSEGEEFKFKLWF